METIEQKLAKIAAKLLPPESSPFDDTGREWRRGDKCLSILHGEYLFAPTVSEAQRLWMYEGALRFVQEHARFYSRFFGEFVEL